MTQNMRERPSPLCGCFVLHHQHFPWPQKHRGEHRTPPANSSFHTFPLFFFSPTLLPLFSHNQEAKGHFHLVISHIGTTSKRSFAYSVYLHRYESVTFIECSAELLRSWCTMYIQSASGFCRFKILSLMFDINQYKGQSSCSMVCGSWLGD